MIIIIKYFQLLNDMKRNYNYSLRQVNHTVGKLLFLDNEVKRSFAEWLDKGKEPKIKVANITFQEQIIDMKMNPYRAFLFLDWLKKDPKTALKALARPTDVVRHSISVDQLAPDLRERVQAELDRKIEEMKISDETEIKVTL